MLINENRWRAHRYGTDQGLIDFGIGKVVPYSGLLNEILSLIKEEAKEAGCLKEINRAKQIVKNGTSAHKQLGVYKKALGNSLSHDDAIKKVVDWLRVETLNF